MSCVWGHGLQAGWPARPWWSVSLVSVAGLCNVQLLDGAALEGFRVNSKRRQCLQQVSEGRVGHVHAPAQKVHLRRLCCLCPPLITLQDPHLMFTLLSTLSKMPHLLGMS